ncbi:MAG: methylmalonyl-CoA mutase family protein, partial [Methyloligellaceae bacterium]
ALGLPRPWDQQWSIRMQQILAYETDLLEYGDIFDGSTEVAAKVDALKAEARDELARIEGMGGAVAAIDYMKQRLVESNTARLSRIESGEQVVVGVNRWTESEPSPLSGAEDGGILTIAEDVEADQIASLEAWRGQRDGAAVEAAIAELKSAASEDRNIMEPSIAAAKAGVTTGEWGTVLREVFGEYRAPTGVGKAAPGNADGLADVQSAVSRTSDTIGRRIKFLVGKPGLDGHSNGAEQIAVRARDSGMEVVYEGIRLTPAQIVNAALEEGVHVVGLSILSGSHLPLVQDVMTRMRDAGLGDIPVIVGGIIPPDDAASLKASGVAAVYTPKDFQLNDIMLDIVRLVEGQAKAA